MNKLLLITALVLCGCGRKVPVNSAMTIEGVGPRLDFSTEDKFERDSMTLRVPLTNGEVTSYPPATYFEDATGQIWDAVWQKRD